MSKVRALKKEPLKRKAKSSDIPVTRKRQKIKEEVIDLLTDDEELKTEPIYSDETHKQESLESEDGILELDTDSEYENYEGGGPSKSKKRKPIKASVKPKKEKTVLINKNVDLDTKDVKTAWLESDLLSEQKCININVAKNIVKLLEEGNTIPFIARYRKDATGNMSPEMLRDVKESYEEICHLKAKIKTVVKTIEKTGKLDENLKLSILSTRTIEELEHIYAPFKPGGKRTLAEKAKELGLEDAALILLSNSGPVNLHMLVDTKKKELSKLELVEKGIVHIIASVIATDTELLNFVRKLRVEANFTIETKKSSTKAEKSKKSDTKINNKKINEETKYENYYNFKIPLKYIKPHQILAINRGESQKCLSVKVVVPDFIFHRFSSFCYNKWINKGFFSHDRKRILTNAVQDSYDRLVQPLIIREIRAELKQKAEKASNEVFSTNLKHLLLAPPLKGKTILGVDPGYSNGCKLAIVSNTGSLLDHNVIYPHRSTNNRGEVILKSMMQTYNCELIALGNGTACRETEQWLSELIQDNFFSPLNITYTIVDEAGASIYSCSPEAKKEFQDLDPNIISAVSLARRIQEPLAELVKVEPKHLGVGMYQHDLKKKQLEESLDEVVSECVSFVGVDLNTASQCLLRRIAGLTDKRATQIIEHREKNGPFTHRKQLTDVKGIGPRIFVQCAGFLRISPTNNKEAVDFYRKPNTTKLDCTYIHPESYDVAKKVLKKFKLKEIDIGEADFINKIKSERTKVDLVEISKEFGCTEGTLHLILDTLSIPLNYDLRSECDQAPLFKKGLTSIYDISVGTELTGRISNVTHFGCFVDIGVGQNGLIHTSEMNGLSLQIGSRVEVKVIKIDIAKKRIGLSALRKL